MPALTPTQKQTLRILRHAGVLTTRDLANRLGIGQKTARDRLVRLVLIGAVKRTPNLQMKRTRCGGGAFHWYEPVEP